MTGNEKGVICKGKEPTKLQTSSSKLQTSSARATGKEWTIHRLGDLVPHPKGHAFKTKYFWKQGYGVIRVSDFTDRSVATDTCNDKPGELASKDDSFALKQANMVIATAES